MVIKGLKKGDIFEDGGLYYEVQSVNKDGSYNSKKVDEPKKRNSRGADKVPLDASQNDAAPAEDETEANVDNSKKN